MKKITFILFSLGFYFSFAQDMCSTAIPITFGTYTVDAVNGTEVPNPICADNGSGATAGEWYSFTSTTTVGVSVTSDLIINACKDTRLHVYTGTCGALTCLVGDDDSGTVACTGSANTYLSTVEFVAQANVTYYIAFDNKWQSTGFAFQVFEIQLPPVGFISTNTSIDCDICAVVDMNNDNLDDIVKVNSNMVTVLTQNTSSGFTTNTYPLNSSVNIPDWSIAAGDFDRNGYNDLALGNSNRISVLRNTNSGFNVINYPQYIFSQRTNFVDINNDGNLDLWACHDVEQNHPYRNDGAGNLVFDYSLFPTSNEGGNYATIWIDYDNDGDIDMYEAKCRGGAAINDPKRINLLYRNNGDGTFTDVAAQAGVNDHAQSWSTAVEDFDNDGDLDMVLSNISDQNKFFLNNGDGTFTDIYSQTGIESQVGSWEIQAADFNNDGWVDFLWQNSKELYINNGDLTFTGYDLPFSEGAIGDLNNDGFLDVQMNNKIYFNTPNENNWTKISLKGMQSNSNGIGARVEIYGTWGKQIREIRSGQGFSHMSTLNAHFGIGSATEITQIIVKWPSGIVDTLLNPEINKALSIVEGSTLAIDGFTNSGFSLFPNPTKKLVNITPSKNQVFKNAKVFDLTGKIVLDTELNSSTLNVEKIASGNYILLLIDENNKNYSQKFIKE